MSGDVQAILERYVVSARGHGEATENGDHRRANRCYRGIMKALHELDTDTVNGRGSLLDILSYDVPSVRAWAATHLLNMYPDEAVAALEEVVRLPTIVGFDAQVVLKEWRKGTLRIP